MSVASLGKISFWLAAIPGLVLALILVYWLNGFIMQDACLDYGGNYQQVNGLCIDPDSQYRHTLKPTPLMWLGYALICLFLSFVSALILQAFVDRLPGFVTSKQSLREK